MGIGAYHGGGEDCESPCTDCTKVYPTKFSFTNNIKRIKTLPKNHNGSFKVCRESGVIDLIRVDLYKESSGESFHIAYWEAEKTLFIEL
jgi:hypothetical protein